MIELEPLWTATMPGRKRTLQNSRVAMSGDGRWVAVAWAPERTPPVRHADYDGSSAT